MKKVVFVLSTILTSVVAYTQVPSMVQDISATRFLGSPGGMLTWQDKMYFVAADTAHGYELWSYDEQSPAQMVFDFNPGKGDGAAALCVYQGKLIFSGNAGSGYEVYSYDGITPPVKLTSFWPGPGVAPPHEFTIAGNVLFFAASHFRPNTPNMGRVTDLFSYKGTDTPVYYAPTPSSSFGLMPKSLVAYNNKLYFAGTTLTMPGIDQIHEVDPATGNIHIVDALAGSSEKLYYFRSPIVLGGKLYFTAMHVKHLTATSADTTTQGSELHCWDGNTIKQLTDFGPGSHHGVGIGLGAHQGLLYFGGIDPDTTCQLFSFDPATEHIELACRVNPVINVRSWFGDMIDYNSRLYFVGTTLSSGFELWQYDKEDCRMVLDIWPGKGRAIERDNPNFHVYKGHLYFCANDSLHGKELWRLKGTTGMTNIRWSGDVRAYPNPTQTNATLDISPGNAQSLEITVLDASGRLLFGKSLHNPASGSNQVAIPMQGWASGVYYYQICDSDGSRLASGRIVRQ